MAEFPTDPAAILRGLIAAQARCMDEARAGRGTGRSAYWARNHPRIAPVLPQAGTLLPPDERRALYATLLRMSSLPSVSAGDLPLLVAAWRDCLPDLALGRGMQASRLRMVHLFGFDDQGAIDAEDVPDLKTLKLRDKAVMQGARYSHLPGQRARRAKFAALADQAPRLLAVLRHCRYRHDHRAGYEATYDYTNLLFWGVVLVVLSHPGTRPELLDDLTGGAFPLPRQAEHDRILGQTVAAVLPDVPATEDRFHRLATALAERNAARLEASDAGRWARAMGLPFVGHDWVVTIALPATGNSGSGLIGPGLRMVIRPDPVSSWRIDITTEDKRQLALYEGRTARQPGLAPPDGLSDLPGWLMRIGRDHDLRHDPARAGINCGRQRAAVRIIAGWLQGGPAPGIGRQQS